MGLDSRKLAFLCMENNLVSVIRRLLHSKVMMFFALGNSFKAFLMSKAENSLVSTPLPRFLMV